MRGDFHVRFCERLGVRFPGATRRVPRRREESLQKDFTRSHAVQKMREGPSEPSCRRRLQTTHGCRI